MRYTEQLRTPAAITVPNMMTATTAGCSGQSRGYADARRRWRAHLLRPQVDVPCCNFMTLYKPTLMLQTGNNSNTYMLCSPHLLRPQVNVEQCLAQPGAGNGRHGGAVHCGGQHAAGPPLQSHLRSRGAAGRWQYDAVGTMQLKCVEQTARSLQTCGTWRA